MMLLRGMSWSGAIFYFFSFMACNLVFIGIYPATPIVVEAALHFWEGEKKCIFVLLSLFWVKSRLT